MITKTSQQDERVAFLKESDKKNAKKELISVLEPLSDIPWLNLFINELTHSDIHFEYELNAATPKFILGISIAACLFMQNKENILKNGLLLKQYIDKYAIHVPLSDQSIVIEELNELIHRTSILSETTQKNTHF